MMRSELVKEFVEMIEADVQNRPSPGEFEMAYQARVAMDRIRFAIKATEINREQSEPLKEAGMQLIDALAAPRCEGSVRRHTQRM
jgi:hypothetical protein